MPGWPAFAFCTASIASARIVSIVSVRGSAGTALRAYRQPDDGRVYPTRPMSVLIASNLRKEFSGDPLFDGISFSVDRGQRLALAGQNGAGKTTLLRAIIGETTIQGGEIALQKGTRIALHDQRPPRDRGLTLREYSLSGAADLVRIEEELRRARAGDGARRRTTTRRCAATARRRRGSSTPAAGTGATVPPRCCAGSASATTTSTGSSRRSRAAS